MNKYYFKLLFVGIAIVLTSTHLQAQVTIGAGDPPEKAALLDIKTKDGGSTGDITSEGGGILLPRIKISDITDLSQFNGISGLNTDEQKERHKGLLVYNMQENLANNIEKGIYVWNGDFWEKAAFRNRVNFFYMPSIPIVATSLGTKTVDLYNEYFSQFNNPKVVSRNAPAKIPVFLNKSDLYYYITGYDTNVFQADDGTGNIFSISEDGVLTYTVKSLPTDGSSYINIVFVVKY